MDTNSRKLLHNTNPIELDHVKETVGPGSVIFMLGA